MREEGWERDLVLRQEEEEEEEEETDEKEEEKICTKWRLQDEVKFVKVRA